MNLKRMRFLEIKWVFLLTFIVSLACKPEVEEPNPGEPAGFDLLELKERYAHHVEALAHDSMNGRWLAGEGIVKTENYLIDAFQDLGIAPDDQFAGYRHEFPIVTNKYKTISFHINSKPVNHEDFLLIPKAPQGSFDQTGLQEIVFFDLGSSLKDQVNAHFSTALPNERFLVIVPAPLKDQFSEFRDHVENLGLYRENVRYNLYGYDLQYGKHDILYVLSEEEEITAMELQYELEPRMLSNIVAVIPGKSRPEEIVVFSAHIDHLGKSAGDDPVYNGANDNASGTAALLVLAEFFKNQDDNNRTILFVGFTAEEIGLVGSKRFVNEFNRLAGVKAVFNIDMIGNISPYGEGKAFITGHARSDLLTLMTDALAPYSMEIFEEPATLNLFARSDNYPFFQAGKVAHTFSTFNPDDPYYHSPLDEMSTVNFNSAINVVHAIALGSESIISGAKTPGLQ
jgi:hypothetical protein